MIAQRILPALAVFSMAAAQCSPSDPIVINSQADVTQYASCSTIEADVVCGTGASGVISFDGPKKIKGSFKCENTGTLTSFGSISIGEITESFTLTNLSFLSTLQMGALTSVKGIKWSGLNALDTLTFTQEVKKAQTVEITNTFLSKLTGINLNTVATMNINNNNRLTEFETQVANITSNLMINANGRDLKVSFPNLIWAANMTFRNISSISMPSLARVNGSLGFYGTSIEGVVAENLTSVGDLPNGQGGLAFVANSAITNITMPNLKTVGGAYQIANNTLLADISFPALESIGGALDFSGNFTTPDLPKLKDIKGGFNMQSQRQIDCSGYDKLKGNVVQGTYTCTTTDNVKTKDGSSGSSTSSGSGSSTTSKAAAVSYGVDSAIAGISVVGGLLQMLL